MLLIIIYYVLDINVKSSSRYLFKVSINYGCAMFDPNMQSIEQVVLKKSRPLSINGLKNSFNSSYIVQYSNSSNIGFVKNCFHYVARNLPHKYS